VKHEERIIVLRKIKHGESDLIIHGLNRQGAKMAFFAKAAAKSKKRFGGGVLEPTHYIKVNYQESRRENGLARLDEAKVLEDFHSLRSDYERLETALYLVSLIEKTSKEGVIDSPDLFDLLGNALRSAQTTTDLGKLRLHFQIRLLASQGVLPAIPAAESFLEKPIKQHLDLQVDEDEISTLKIHIQSLLDQYLG
jgi:DNA repair protein RecO (recombination protein O)